MSALTPALKTLIDAGAIPPFVYCYPPRSSYRQLDADVTIDRIWDFDARVTPSKDLSVYIHVPFCRYKCGFCNLYTVTSTNTDLYDAYVAAICRELRRHARIIQSRNLRTIYIGGGTPSLLNIRHFEEIFRVFDEIYPNWRPGIEEVCLEATPDSIVQFRDTVKTLLQLGLTRINMGVQSLDNMELKEAGRMRASEEVIHKAVHVTNELELPNLSTDLIMGFAGQTDATWLRSVTELVKLAPHTISTYFLTVRPDAWFSKTAKYAYTRSPGLYSRYDVAREIIKDAGYVQESNVRYKLMGRGGYRQKVQQFRGVPVLGIGVGARTYTNTLDYITGGGNEPNISQVHDYIKCSKEGSELISGGYHFNDEERIRKRFVLDLFDLDLRELEAFDIWSHADIYEDLLAAGIELGLIMKVGETRYQLTPAGYKYRDILSWLTFSEEVLQRDKEFYQMLHSANRRATVRLGEKPTVSGLDMLSDAAS